MKKYLVPLLVCSANVAASELQVSVDLLDGTYVGESKYYYDLPYSDLPGFYHQKNSVEWGIGIQYIHDFENWDAMVKFSMGDSELRHSHTWETGARYRLNESHWFSARWKGTFAKEEYQIDDRIIDPEHQNSITNGEWAMWAIGRYQYNLQPNFDLPLYLGFEAATDLNDPALMQDKLAGFIGYRSDQYFAEVRAGEDLIFATFGMSFDMFSDNKES
ncbi:hypothetical protein [Vibrio atypicus]|uniref:hypothetical protein n=1 Tax=Vibrio atypicus TaxID=558271 RepID=UPI00135740E2|nr:hypothetical protein [Vibrio atypicus]